VQATWKSLAFEFGDGKLIRQWENYPHLELAPSEVSAVIESPKGITIKTSDRVRRLFVSKKLANYETFRDALICWAPAVPVTEAVPSSWDYVRTILELFACVFAFGGPLYLVYTSEQRIVFPVGIASLLAMLALILYIRRSPDIPIMSRKAIWILLLLPILAMVVHVL
jgi:hypothetical protein